MSEEWFEEWFDSPLYELIYADRNEEEAARLALLIRETIPPQRYPKLLDLGCGRGRHAITLAGSGYRVTGIDLSEEAIRKARRKADGLGLDSIRFLVGDMRDPLPERFDAIVNLFTTFGYFSDDEENIRVLRGVHGMLRREGIFFMDYMNAPLVRRRFEPEGEGEFRGIRYRIRRYIESDTIHKEIRFEGEALDSPKSYIEKVKLYEPEWFESAFRGIGMTIETRFGDYGGRPYDPENSPRLVMVVRKNA